MKGKIKIHTERCKGCAYCFESCPSGVIAMSAHFNRSGFYPAVVLHCEKCTGCAICANMCPEVAIEVYRDNRKA
jgi:2-oxoglutarate ferredoxin oxidoreductase subunit delta